MLVLALLTAAVAASIGLALAAYTTTPVPDNAEFGAANHFVRFGNTDRGVLGADVAAARDAFDTHEVIYHSRVPVPGLFEPVDYRAQDPDGPLGGPRLALVEGTHPTGDQVAMTDGMADLFDVRHRRGRWRLTGYRGPSSASSRTRATWPTSSCSSRRRRPARRTT